MTVKHPRNSTKKAGKPKAKTEETPDFPIAPVSQGDYHDPPNEFEEFMGMGQDPGAESERFARTMIDASDIEGKTFLLQGEEYMFTHAKALADNPKFEDFRLERFPQYVMHLKTSLGGQGRKGVLESLRGIIQIRPEQPDMPPGGMQR